jgi:Icc-related predicted phosphoesterase
MNILAFVDLHGNKKKFDLVKEKAKTADLVLCAGDLTNFENSYDELLQELNNLKKFTFIIHGNHESEESTFEKVRHLEYVKFIHRKVLKFKDYYFFGWGGGGFSEVDSELEKKQAEFEKVLKGKKFIFLTHAPPYNTACDDLNNKHVGCRTIRRFIERNQPLVNVCGHLHETAHTQSRIGKCVCINPGGNGSIIKISV